MELHFKASFLIRILRQLQRKMSYGHVTKISRDDGLLSELTTEVNGNVLYCKGVDLYKSYETGLTRMLLRVVALAILLSES